MGQLAVTVAGGIIGSFFGMPQLGLIVGGMLGQSLFAPTVQGPRLTDLTVTASTYGNAVNYLFGTSRMNGNVIWSTKLQETDHKTMAGKGGQSQTTFTYSASFAVAFCTGTANMVTRIWGDSKLIYGCDSSQLLAENKIATNQQLTTQILEALTGKGPSEFTNLTFRFYPGSETQLPDGLIEQAVGSGMTPAYRGLCYIVFENLPLANFGNRIPSITAEITKLPASTAPNLTPVYGSQVPSDSGSIVDWIGNTMYVWDNSNTLFSYDLTTMQQVKAIPLPYRPQGFTPGGGPFYTILGPGNAGPMAIMNSSNGSVFLLGHHGGGIGDDPGYPYSLTSPTFTTGVGTICGFFTQDSYGVRTDYFIHIDGFASMSMYTSTGGFLFAGRNPLANGGPFSSNLGIGNISTCSIPQNGAEVILWSSDTNGLAYQRWHVGNGVTGTVTQGSVFEPDASEFFTEAVVLGNVSVSVSLYIETVKTIDSTGKYVTIQTITRDQYGSESITYTTRKKTNLDSAGTVYTYPQTTTVYDHFSPSFLIIDPTDSTANMVGQYSLNGNTIWGFLRWSLIDKAVKVARVWNLPSDNSGYPIHVPSMDPASRLAGNTIGWLDQIADYGQAPHMIVVSLVSGDITASPFTDPNASGFASLTTNGPLGGYWDDQSQSLVCTPQNRKATRFYFRNYGDNATVADIVSEMIEQSQVLTTSDIDVSGLEAMSCIGYVVSNVSSIKDCLSQLSQAFFFDAVESDYTLKFVARGGDSAVTIPEEYLGIADAQTQSSVKEVITQEFELPMRITMSYYSFERDYQTGTMFSKRMINPVPSMYSPVKVQYELPLIMTATQAKQITDKALQTAWAGRSNITLNLSWRYIAIDPTDVITVDMNDGTVYRLRTDKMDLGVDYTLQGAMISDSAASYVSNITTADSGTFIPQSIQAPGKALPVIINTPLLRDTDDTQGNGSMTYFGFTLPSGGFSKGVLIENSPTGYNYAILDSLGTETTSGIVQNALPDVVDGESTDETNTLQITLHPNAAALETITRDDLLAGGNAALVGDEVIQFMTAEQDDHGVWTLSSLLRGRRGTQYAISGHVANETFVLLTPASLDSYVRSSATYNQKTAFIAVNNGTTVSEATPVTVNLEPNDLKPYTPEAFAASSTGGSVTVGFQRRSRKTFGIADGVWEAPYFEGQGPGASMKWQVFYDANLNDPTILAGTKTPDQSGQIMIYNSDGSFADLSFSIPYVQPDPFTAIIAILNGATPSATLYSSFVARVWEVGYVDGFPKIVKFTAPVAPNGNKTDGVWAYAELY